MTAYVEPPPIRSRCLRRIADALTRYAPDDVEIVSDRAKADFVFLHVIGRQERMYREARQATRRKQRYAVGQWCLRSTQKASTEGWRALWDGAAAVWSYYDLDAAIAADGGAGTVPRFHHAPLGVDTMSFHPTDGLRPYTVAMTGFDRHYVRTESFPEVVNAARRVDGTVWHLGPPMPLGPHVTHEEGMDDATLAQRYSQCRYVSGLRRVEGFELPAAEGLLCDARPVMFDRPDAQWFRPWAVCVPEGPRPAVTETLARVFAQPTRGLTTAEWAEAADRFSWRRIVTGFWDRCLAS